MEDIYFKCVSIIFGQKEHPFLLPGHYTGHEDGDIQSAETGSMSPHSSEKDTEQNMRNKPPAAEMVTYTRLNRIKHLATSKKKRKSDTSTVFTPGAKRQKQKDNAENIVDTSTLQHQPLPLMVLPPTTPTGTKKQGERKKKNKRQRVEKEQDDTNSKGSDTNDDDDDREHDADFIPTDGDDAEEHDSDAEHDDDVKTHLCTNFEYHYSALRI